MFATRSLLIIGIFCINSVISEKVLCDLEDSKCLTKSAGVTFEQFISGIPGVESSEPLYAKLIEANHPELSYKYTDVKLSGMKDCKVELVRISAKDIKYDYHVGCPLLTFESKYELNGDVGTLHIEGTGDAKVGFYDVHFLFHGDYAKKAGAGGKSHINLKTHELDVQVKGKLHFELKNLFDGDKEKSDFAHKALNDNWEPVAKAYSKEIMEPLMNTFLGNVNSYLDFLVPNVTHLSPVTIPAVTIPALIPSNMCYYLLNQDKQQKGTADLSEKVLCDLGNSICLTKSAGLTFEQFIYGMPGFESSDPLYAKLIKANHPELSYKYTDVKLSGMKDCKVELVGLTPRYLRYEYQVGCPLLTLEAEYEINGEVGTLHIEGKGDAKVDFYDSHFVFHGDYANKVGAGGKTYINFKTHELDVLINGKLHFDFKNLFDGDKEKSDVAHKAINDNWEPVAKAYCKEIMDPLMNKYLDNVNAHLDVVSVEDLFSYEE